MSCLTPRYLETKLRGSSAHRVWYLVGSSNADVLQLGDRHLSTPDLWGNKVSGVTFYCDPVFCASNSPAFLLFFLFFFSLYLPFTPVSFAVITTGPLSMYTWTRQDGIQGPPQTALRPTRRQSEDYRRCEPNTATESMAIESGDNPILLMGRSELSTHENIRNQAQSHLRASHTAS